jgi:hypothetical protein
LYDFLLEYKLTVFKIESALLHTLQGLGLSHLQC